MFRRTSEEAVNALVAVIGSAMDEEPGSARWMEYVAILRGNRSYSSALLVELAEMNPHLPYCDRVWKLIGTMGGYPVPMLTKLVNHDEPSVQYNAALALAAIAQDRRNFVLNRDLAVDCLKKVAKKHPDDDMKQLARHLLWRIANPEQLIADDS